MNVKKSFVGIEANFAAGLSILTVSRRRSIQNNFAFVEGYIAVNIFNVGLLNLDGRALDFNGTEISQSVVAVKDVHGKFFSRASQNLYAFGKFICRQKGQNLIKKNFVDFDIDDFLSFAYRARSRDECIESFGVDFGGDGVHVRAVRLRRNFR